MDRYFTENARSRIRCEIVEASGNEVFFVGHTNGAGVVIDVEPLARGNRDAVAAIVIASRCGDVVIHNHPDGPLTPSNADLEIASILGNQGVGFIIVDNYVERCYVAVTPFIPPTLETLAFEDIESFYAPGGRLSSSLDGYEYREEQVRMAFLVADAFNEDKVSIIEAGTGTGKSLAYLLPAALWAIRNKERVVISTNTINLQEQLTRKDIPFLQEHAGIDFKAVLVKGRSNYLCKRKLTSVKRDPALFQDEATEEMQTLLEWSGKTVEGCRNDLPFIPRQEIWEEICCEADQCTRAKCEHYNGCFFFAARRAAAAADILVVNHALLMADIAVRMEAGYESSAILPPFKRLIFDEGHHLEDVATSHFGSQSSRHSVLKLFSRLQHPKKPQRGLLPQLSATLSREIPEELEELYMDAAAILEDRLLRENGKVADSITKGMDAIATAMLAHIRSGGGRTADLTLRITPAVSGTVFWQETRQRIRQLVDQLSGYAATIKDCCRLCERLPEPVLAKVSSPLIDIRGIRGRIEAIAEGLSFFIADDESYCRWMEVAKGSKGLSVKLCFAPLEVSESLRKAVFEQIRTVVITSATLAVGERFDYLKKRTGIAALPGNRVSELLLASPFDYDRQAFVGIPADLPEPTSPAFPDALENCLLQAISVTNGGVFVLFTSYDLLRRMFDRLSPQLKSWGITALRQGEASRHTLINRFRREGNAVLFATDSFWEGVDVQGKALELVVIARLPFRVPTEPLLEARAEHIAEEGGDPFMEYTVPQAVIKFKQGFGRLIRSREDRGAALILDTRVLTKNYGRSFLKALPGTAHNVGSQHEVLERMKSFFSSC